jgi:hypothetical protein
MSGCKERGSRMCIASVSGWIVSAMSDTMILRCQGSFGNSSRIQQLGNCNHLLWDVT